MSSKLPQRRSIRLANYDYSQIGLYFVTICCENRICRFGKIQNTDIVLNEAGRMINTEWNNLKKRFSNIELHNYIIMPNHFHLILEIDGLKVNINEIKIKSLSSLMGALKTTTSKQIRDFGFIDFAWHRSFHDHIIRNEKEYDLISNYIDRNPQKWFEDRFYSN